MSIAQYGKQFPVLLRMLNPKGHVELLETVGKGNYGYVYKGKMLKRNSELAAIKETLLEMEILEACSHPHITKYYGCFLKGLDLWICMEFAGAGSVDSIYRALKRPVSEDAIASIIYESMLGLNYLHTKVALIHRDIKAGNLLLTLDGVVKLADFGVSAQLTTIGGRANSFIGTPYWMAPEVIACDPDTKTNPSASYTDKSDIWSIGITCIEIAEKNPPLSDIHPMQALHLIAKSDMGFSKPKLFSKQFVDYVSFCLNKNYDKRPSAAQCLEHPFLARASQLDRSAILSDLVQKVQSIKDRKKKGLEVTEEDEDELFGYKGTAGSQVSGSGSSTMQNTLNKAKNAIDKLTTIKPNNGASDIITSNDFPPISNHVSEGTTTPVFEPISLTSLGVETCTADFLDGQYILLGTERGLYFLDITKPTQKTPSALIHEVKFTQIQVLHEYGVLMALSGRHSHIRQYSLASIRKLIMFVEGKDPLAIKKTDTTMAMQQVNLGADGGDGYLDDTYANDELSLLGVWTADFIKIPNTRDSKSFLVEETEATAFITILFSQGITLFRWAVSPYDKFMKVKSFWVPETPMFVSFGQDGVSAVDLFIGYQTELNRVTIGDSKVSELGVHKEMKSKGMVKPRWRCVRQIPFSDAKLEQLLKDASNRGTTSRKVAALTGPTLGRSNATDRYFLGTFDRLTKVVDSKVVPMVGAGVGGWKDGVMWSEPPVVQILRPLQHVISVGKNNIEIVEWKSAQLRQRLSVESGTTFRVLSSKHGYTLIAVERKKKGFMIYWMRENTPAPRPPGILMKKIQSGGRPVQEYIAGERERGHDSKGQSPQQRSGPPQHHDPRNGPPHHHDPRNGPPQHHDPRNGPPQHHDPRNGPPQHHDPRNGPPQHDPRGSSTAQDPRRPSQQDSRDPQSVHIQNNNPRVHNDPRANPLGDPLGPPTDTRYQNHIPTSSLMPSPHKTQSDMRSDGAVSPFRNAPPQSSRHARSPGLEGEMSKLQVPSTNQFNYSDGSNDSGDDSGPVYNGSDHGGIRGQQDRTRSNASGSDAGIFSQGGSKGGSPTARPSIARSQTELAHQRPPQGYRPYDPRFGPPPSRPFDPRYPPQPHATYVPGDARIQQDQRGVPGPDGRYFAGGVGPPRPFAPQGYYRPRPGGYEPGFRGPYRPDLNGPPIRGPPPPGHGRPPHQPQRPYAYFPQGDVRGRPPGPGYYQGFPPGPSKS